MKSNEIKKHILNGTLEQAIKQNNRQWVLIFCLFITVWIGYAVIINNRLEDKAVEHSQCDSIHKVQALTIEMQLEKLNQAVYFKDIK